jgi:hypothetical protein
MRYRDLVETTEAVDLIQRYRHFNDLLFDGTLPEIPVIWASLKTVGGVTEAQRKVDPTKPMPDPRLVRLGREDKFANWVIIPGTLRIRISSLYRRSALAIDKILIHEMIHVHLIVTGHMGEQHGTLFQAERRRCGRIVGYDIPLKDKVEDGELSGDVKIRPYGVILIERRGGGHQYVMLPAATVEAAIETIRERLNYFVRHNYFVRACVYVVSDQMWSEQAKKITVQRSFSHKTKYFRLTDQTAIDDLHQNGRLLVDLAKSNSQLGELNTSLNF